LGTFGPGAGLGDGSDGGGGIGDGAASLFTAGNDESKGSSLQQSQHKYSTTHLYTGTSTSYSFFTSFCTHFDLPHFGGGFCLQQLPEQFSPHASQQRSLGPGRSVQNSSHWTVQQYFFSFFTSQTSWQVFFWHAVCRPHRAQQSGLP